MKKQEMCKVYIGAIFTIFFFLLFRNLTNASLWVDEGIEYWFSKSIHAIVPGDAMISTMYERIIGTYQPPLYNVLMYMWLQINDTEIWFRLFGVVMGLGAGVALYKAIEKNVSINVGLVSILFLANVYQFVYYVQECAEYNLMFFTVSWTLYYFLECLREISVKNICLFTTFCVLSVYSQYGTVFFVFGFAGVLLVWNIIKHKKTAVVKMAISYLCAIVFTAIPLYVFFISKQLENQIKVKGTTIAFNTNDNLFIDIVKGLKNVLEFNFIPNNTIMRWVIWLLLVVVLVATIILFKKKDELTVVLFSACALMTLAYCILVKVGVYGYGNWGARYSLFMLPVIFLYAVIVIGKLWGLYQSCENENIQQDAIKLLLGIVFGAVCMYSMQGYQHIGKGWIKEDNKDMFKYWYLETPADCETLVYYGAVPVFSFYLEHEENYIPAEIINENMRMVTLQPNMRNLTKDEYVEYLTESYEYMPEKICFLCSHFIVDDWKVMLEAFGQLGYEYEIMWEGYQAQVIMLNQS